MAIRDRDRLGNDGGSTPHRYRITNNSNRQDSQIDILNIDDTEARKTLKNFFEMVRKEAASTNSELGRMYNSLTSSYDNEIDTMREKLRSVKESSRQEGLEHNKRLKYIQEEFALEMSLSKKIDEQIKLRERNEKTFTGRRIINNVNQRNDLSRQVEDIKSQILSGRDKSGKYLTEGNIKNLVQRARSLESSIRDLDQSTEELIDRQEKRVSEFTEVFKSFINDVVSIFTSQFKSGVVEYFSAYENSFTEFAGRMQTSYSETRSFYDNAISTLYNSGLFSSVNINSQLIPALTTAVQQGFTGTDAISKAIADSESKILVPWLDTASEAWVNMSFNMSKGNMELLKSQQLQLQTTKAGNRLLQSGVVNSLTSEMEPLLRNIDFNTGGANNLSEEYQAIMAGLVEQGMTANDAYSYVQQLVSVQKNQYSALTSGDTAKILMASGFVSGESPLDIMNGKLGSIYGMAASSSNDLHASAIMSTLGLTGPAFTKEIAKEVQDGIAYAYSNVGSSSITWKDALNNIEEYTTATTKQTNSLQNVGASTIGEWITAIPQGDKWFTSVLDLLKGILTAIIGGKLIDKLLNTEKIRSILSSIEGATSGKLGGLGSSNASINTISLSSILKGLGITTGIAEATYGGYNMVQEINKATDRSNTNSQKDIATKSAIGYGTGAAAGATGALALALGASGPVGWIALGVGAVSLGATEIYKSYNKTSEVLLELESEFDNQKNILEETNKTMKSNLDSIVSEIDNMNTLEDKKKYLLDSGLATEEQLTTMTSSSIENFLASLNNMTDKLLDAQEKALDELEKLTKEEVESRRKSNADLIKQDILSSTGNDQIQKLRALGYTDEEIARIGTKKGLFGLGGTYTAEDLLNEKSGKFLGIFGGQTKLDTASVSTYDEYGNIFGLNGYQQVSVDSNILSQIAEAAGILDTYRGTTIPQYKEKYNKAKAFLAEYYNSYGSKIDSILNDPLSSYAVGTPYVYNDELAQLHEGERVLTKSQNSLFTAIGGIGLLSSGKLLLNSLFGLQNYSQNDIEDDISREDMTKTIINGIGEIVSAISNINNSENSIDYNTRTLPRITNEYNKNLINLAPTISANS